MKLEVTIEQLTDILNAYEPEYPKATRLGPDALPHLNTLVKSEDVLLASKAAYLASLIQDEKSIDVLETGTQSEHPEVRVAVAAGARNLKPTISAALNLESKRFYDLLSILEIDEDSGVRKEVLKSLKSLRSTE